MTQEEVHASLDAMLENQKSRNFLNHLVRAYMPVSNIEKVINKPEGDFKCAISREQLISTQEILDGVRTEEFKTDLMTSLKNMFDDKADKTTAMAKFIGEKKVGVTGKGTTTFLSVPVAQELVNWVMTKALSGDKHINWLIGSIKHASFMNRAASLNEKSKDKLEKIAEKNDRTAKYQLGDANGALAALKAKLEGSEK
jgi:hypothetical protein